MSDPVRLEAGIQMDGRIIWGRLTHSCVLGMLKNPSYAGTYVFGRYQYRRQISPDGGVHKRIHAVAMSDWRVSLKEHHEGYITLEEFLARPGNLWVTCGSQRWD